MTVDIGLRGSAKPVLKGWVPPDLGNPDFRFHTVNDHIFFYLGWHILNIAFIVVDFDIIAFAAAV